MNSTMVNITDVMTGRRNDTENRGSDQLIINTRKIKELDINARDALFRSMAIVLACTAILCNYFVLKALAGIPSENLKSRLFILNMLFADFLVPLFSSFDIIVYIIYAFGVTDDYIHTCVALLYALCTPAVMYYQCLASLVLACDRVYAVLAPLKYYTIGYPRWMSSCTIIFTWITPLILIMPVCIIPYVKPIKVAGSGVCYKLMAGHIAWTASVRFIILLCVGMVTFSIYILLFILLKRIRGENVALNEERLTNRKRSVSITITYFMVHCTSLAFFLPGPIYALLTNLHLKSFQLNRSTHKTLRLVSILLYMFNPIVDPIILSLRIPAIKEKLTLMLGSRETSHRR